MDPAIIGAYMKPFGEWPTWLQFVILFPHGLLGFFATWFWWPKTSREWRKFGFVAAYLFVFYCVMRFVFKI